MRVFVTCFVLSVVSSCASNTCIDCDSWDFLVQESTKPVCVAHVIDSEETQHFNQLAENISRVISHFGTSEIHVVHGNEVSTGSVQEVAALVGALFLVNNVQVDVLLTPLDNSFEIVEVCASRDSISLLADGSALLSRRFNHSLVGGIRGTRVLLVVTQ